MVGNAVPVEFARALAEKIMADLKEYKKSTSNKNSQKFIRKTKYKMGIETIFIDNFHKEFSREPALKV